MELTQTLTLAGLALIDSTSAGTLVLPVFLMMLPGVRASRVLLHLVTISVFYFGVGIAMLLGAHSLVTSWGSALDSRAAYVLQLVIGIAMFAASWFVDPGKKNAERAQHGLPPEPSRWERRLAGNSGAAAVVVVALLAGIAELAMMLPYLGAVGIITASGMPLAARAGVLAGYVALMCAPALVVLGIRLTVARHAEEGLQRLRNWLARQSAASVPWVLGILGFLLAGNALSQLRG